MNRGLLLLLAVSTIGITTSQAQESQRGPDGGTTFHVRGVDVLPMTGKPFSGIDHIVWTRTLEDGSIIKQHLDAIVARDGVGRIYRESHTFTSDGSSEPSKFTGFSIYDPTLHTRTACSTATHRCTVSSFVMPSVFTEAAAGSFDKGKRILARDSLGTNTLSGLDVIGTREILTINAGVLGNDRPLTTIREFWYSPDLEVNLAVTRKDPREGTQEIHLESLSRSEPPPERFQVPAGYSIEDTRQESAGH